MTTELLGCTSRKNVRCTLILGDSTQLLPRLKSRCAHAIVTDPPYGTTDCSWDQAPDMAAFWAQADRLTMETAVVAIFGAQPFTTDVINSNRRNFRYELVWDKLHAVGFLNANRQPLRIHEHLLIFCRRPGGSTYQPQFVAGKPYVTKKRLGETTKIYRGFTPIDTINPGRRHPTSILRFPKPANSDRIHPTQKPTPLLQWIVKSFTRRNQTVLDPYFGSGSAAEACLLSGRRFIGMERDPAMFALAVDRLSRRFGASKLRIVR